jgi:hypothetical protein
MLPDAGNTCTNGNWCYAPGCNGGGTCMPLPPNLAKAPVCGCDGITYWNVGTAAGKTVGSMSGCGLGSLACGGFIGLSCPSGTYCNYQVDDPSMCFVSDQGGTCWALPTVCPAAPVARACGNGTSACSDECTLMKGSGAWYEDAGCP